MGNNEVGGAGLNWKIRMVPIRVSADKADPVPSDVAAAFDYAIVSRASIVALKEINGIKIADLESSMRPGKLSKAGFLGDKERLLEVMAADNDWIVQARLTHQEIACHLRVLAVVSRRESKPFIYHGTRLRAKIIQYDGFQESPFNDGTKASTDVALENLDNGERIWYSSLVPMMVERYGFYESKGTLYRVDPKAVVKVLPFLTAKKQAGRK